MQLILHLAMAVRGHVVLDPGRDGRRFVWQIGLTIRFLNERLAHQILRSSENAAIGSYLGPSNPRSPGMGTMVHIPRRPEICQRTTLDPKPPPLRPQNLPEDFIDRCRCKPRKPQRSGPSGAWWAYVMALLTGSPRVR